MASLTTNFNFKLPAETDYYSVGTVNENTQAIDNAIIQSARTEIIVAAYNSNEKIKRRADVVCGSGDCYEKLKAVIAGLDNGDTLRFAAGTYDIYCEDKEGIVIDKRIKIVGCGIEDTHLVQKLTDNSTEGCSIFTVKSSGVSIEDIMLCDEGTADNANALIDLCADGITIKNVFFIQNIASDGVGYCVRGNGGCHYVRIEDCRIYRSVSSPQRPMFNFKNADFEGVIGGTIISGYDTLSIAFKDEVSKNKTVFYGNSEVSYL